MRHAKKINHLGRTNTHRKAMLSNMASSLIMHKRITTTTAKAKALKVYVEPLITRSKNDTTHSRRVVFSYLQDKDAVSELFRDISPKIMDRPGGYTRILKTGFRKGDAAEMCIIELVDYNENMLAAKDTKAKSTTTRRSRRGGTKKAAGATTAEAATPAAEAAPKAKAKKAEKVEAVKTEETVVEAPEVKEEVKEEETAVKTEEQPKEEVKEEEAPSEEKEEKKEE
ncbi:MAG: 50S ribosomal protein L17 [Bacteroidales bacterium]|jgi:large subunit ribosomal protein L17|nr:50S ribosomal protein L17 [Bacteroidales bacterium]